MGKNYQKKLFNYYNQNEEYFELAEKGQSGKNNIIFYQKILNRCKNKKGFLIDLGCGTGLDIFAMTGKNNFCLGLDISKLAINRAVKRADKKKIKNVDFKQSNLDKIFLKDNSVNTITSFWSFEHLLNPEKVLSEADRILKKDGEIFILCPNFSSPFRGAPVYGWYSKDKILKKMILSLSRIFSVLILRKKDFKVKMIDESLIDFNKIGEDWDAANEPSIFEFINYFRRKNYQVDFKTWLSPPKTMSERFFSYFKNFLIIKYWGPVCYFYAKKR